MSSRIARAKTIKGWMSHVELAWLEKNAAGRELVIELGSFLGRSSVALAAAKKLICVDKWTGMPGVPVSPDIAADIRAAFLNNVAGAGDITPVTCDLADPTAVAALVATYQHAADLVFVDAAHDEQSVARDIATALQLLKSGGLLCGHDYSNDYWPGVVKAVNRLLPAARLAGAGMIWAYQTAPEPA